MKYLFLVVCCLITTNLCAQPLTITKSGYFLTVVDAEGVPTYVKITDVIDLRGEQPPVTPSPNPPVSPPQLDMELVRDVKLWAEGAKEPQASQAIAAVYLTVRQAKLESPWPILKQATDDSLKIVESSGNWETFRKNLSAVITERSQKGTLDNETVLRSVQQGLEMSADGSIALPDDVINKIKDTTKGFIKGATYEK